MSSANRRKSTAVINQIEAEPYRFQFVQAVRLMQRALYFSAKQQSRETPLDFAKYAPPHREYIRFHTRQQLSFAPAEIFSVELQQNEINQRQFLQWHMTVMFLGLTGASGVLPYHYSELLLEQIKDKNYAFADFFELFNHRSVSLFFRASTKYRLAYQYEKSLLDGKGKRDDFTQALLSIIGIGTGHLTQRLLTQDDSLLYYAGLFSQRVRTASGLERMLTEHFSMSVKV